MAATFDLQEVRRRMESALGVLKHELGGLRTGRASASLLEPIHVEAYGAHMPIAQVATISVPEPRLISVQVWDRGMVGAVEKAIRDSGQGLNPASDGQVVRVPIPPLTEERRREYVKMVRSKAEDARVAVRNVRREEVHRVQQQEKEGEIPEDQAKRALEQLQKITD